MSKAALIFGKGTSPAPGGPVSSAGVFDSNGVLVRTIWSAETNNPNVSNPAAAWDGALDDGTVAPTGSYTLKVVSHGITYNWDIANGSIGNSSTGPWGVASSLNIWNGGTTPQRLTITTAGQIWATTGYNEKYVNVSVSSRSNIQSQTYFGGPTGSQNSQRDIVADDVRVYINYDISSQSGVYVIDIASNSVVNFSGNPIIGGYTVIGFDNTPQNFIGGLAVQRTGSFLFIARPDLNSIFTLNKTTGATLVTNAGFTNVTQLAANPASATELWCIRQAQTIVSKLAVDGAGNITLAGINLTFSNAQDIAVSPDGTRLLVVEGDTIHQVKAYNTSDGSAQTGWATSGILGTLNGYTNSSIVNNTTFNFLSDTPFGGTTNTFLAFDPLDGSFWLGDSGNWRTLHFTSGNNPTFIEALYYRGGFYACFPCKNDPTKVVAGWCVYTMDLSQPLQYGNGSWTLTNNFNRLLGNNFDPFSKMRFFIKASNGLYYSTVGDAPGGGRFVLECQGVGGFRDTNSRIDDDTYVDDDFNLWVRSVTGAGGSTPCTIRKNPFTGFDGSNNPTWQVPPKPNSGFPVYLVTDPIPATFGQTGGDNNFYWPDDVLSNGVIPMFDPSENSYNHLAGVDATTGKWKFNTMPVTASNHARSSSDLYLYPEPPFFDGSAGPNPGGQLWSKKGENHFFVEFRGEQTEGGQANMLFHFHESGLLLDRFGAVGTIFGMASLTFPNGTSLPNVTSSYKGYTGMTGNSGWGGAIKDSNTGIWYVYENDEWYQGGITRWSIHNVNTIKVDQFPFVWNSANFPANVDPTDLMFGLPYNTSLIDNTAGWHRSPMSDISAGGDVFFCRTNEINSRRTSPDLSISFFTPVAGVSGQTYRDIPRVHTGNWHINATIAMFPINPPSQTYFFEVLDNTGKTIVRLQRDVLDGSNNTTVLVNGMGIAPRINTNALNALIQGRTPLTISANVLANTLSVTFTTNNWNIVVSPMDVGANIAAPAKFQMTYTQQAGSGAGCSGSIMTLNYTEA